MIDGFHSGSYQCNWMVLKEDPQFLQRVNSLQTSRSCLTCLLFVLFIFIPSSLLPHLSLHSHTFLFTLTSSSSLSHLPLQSPSSSLTPSSSLSHLPLPHYSYNNFLLLSISQFLLFSFFCLSQFFLPTFISPLSSAYPPHFSCLFIFFLRPSSPEYVIFSFLSYLFLSLLLFCLQQLTRHGQQQAVIKAMSIDDVK